MNIFKLLLIMIAGVIAFLALVLGDPSLVDALVHKLNGVYIND